MTQFLLFSAIKSRLKRRKGIGHGIRGQKRVRVRLLRRRRRRY